MKLQAILRGFKVPDGEAPFQLRRIMELSSSKPIRKEILEADLIETIIGLGPNLFYGTGISACILVLKLNKEKNDNLY